MVLYSVFLCLYIEKQKTISSATTLTNAFVLFFFFGSIATTAGTPMGITAENLAKKYNITKEECDEFALRSQQTWGAAQEKGIFDAEMAPITLQTRKGEVTVDMDEHPRPSTTLEQLGKLRPTFAKDGVVTAGSASGICDGAGTIVVASEQAVQEW